MLFQLTSYFKCILFNSYKNSEVGTVIPTLQWRKQPEGDEILATVPQPQGLHCCWDQSCCHHSQAVCSLSWIESTPSHKPL